MKRWGGDKRIAKEKDTLTELQRSFGDFDPTPAWVDLGLNMTRAHCLMGAMCWHPSERRNPLDSRATWHECFPEAADAIEFVGNRLPVTSRTPNINWRFSPTLAGSIPDPLRSIIAVWIHPGTAAAEILAFEKGKGKGGFRGGGKGGRNRALAQMQKGVPLFVTRGAYYYGKGGTAAAPAEKGKGKGKGKAQDEAGHPDPNAPGAAPMDADQQPVPEAGIPASKAMPLSAKARGAARATAAPAAPAPAAPAASPPAPAAAAAAAAAQAAAPAAAVAAAAGLAAAAAAAAAPATADPAAAAPAPVAPATSPPAAMAAGAAPHVYYSAGPAGAAPAIAVTDLY